MDYSKKIESALVTVEAIFSVRTEFAHACRTQNRDAVRDAHARLTSLYASLDPIVLSNALVERMRLEVTRDKPVALAKEQT